MHNQSKSVHEIMLRIINKASSLMTEPRNFGIDGLMICYTPLKSI